MKLTLEGIEALEAIADTGSFAGAARALHKVQSAISYNVRQLEAALGVALFDRSGHRAVLTAAGRAVLDEGRFLLARARRIEALAARFADGWEARLQVVVDGALPIAPILGALTTLGEEEIPTHVQLRTEYLGGVPRRFEALGADLMVTLSAPTDPLLSVTELPSITFALVAAPSHPLAQAERIALGELQRHLELSVHDSDEATWAEDTNLIPGARVFYVGDFAAKKEGLLRGLGVGWMPLGAVEGALADGRLVELPYAPGSRRRFPVSIAFRHDRPLGPAGIRLRDLLVAALAVH